MQASTFRVRAEIADVPLPLHPGTFSERYVAAQATPYSFSSRQQPSFAGGVLRGGQAVWLEPATAKAQSVKTGKVQAFIDELGLIVLDSRWLLRREA